jgi:hypothetical protein
MTGNCLTEDYRELDKMAVWTFSLNSSLVDRNLLPGLAEEMKLRFTIRDLLWLILVLALAVGCWLEPGRMMPNGDDRIVPFRFLAILFGIVGVLFVAGSISD